MDRLDSTQLTCRDSTQGCDVSGKFSNTKKPEGPNGFRQLASHIYELLMPDEAGEKVGAVQAGAV